ncbi:E3 ubiquitin-protein ligase ZNF598-like [Ptychodera flava]|uniref:E3 ubiquitin-protein ligase ZNF598-like n=1 Tax=Ptychodera flava TaxID=63121 RepID=UPI00396A32FA
MKFSHPGTSQYWLYAAILRLSVIRSTLRQTRSRGREASHRTPAGNSKMSKTTDNIQSTCVVCCQDIKIYATGHCDHPVCYRCSTRMRVLSNQKYCAVCRTDLDKIIFVEKLHKFASEMYHKFPCDRKHQIYFKNSRLKLEFNKLLQHVCKICAKTTLDCTFGTFNKLRDHMRKEHELFYCDLCVEHIQIFTEERKVYTRSDLARHRRQGDPDDKSHKGHPLCEFCDVRYLDNDELFKHLRREHYFCHFCDTQGSQQYYSDYPVLRDHFRDQHFLCEEGPCKDEQFTSAFNSEIDLKAHRAVRHAKKMSKSEVKQTRQLDLGFNYTPRSQSYSRGAGVVSGEDFQEVSRYSSDPNRQLHSRTKSRGRGRRREEIETSMAIRASLESHSSADATNAGENPKEKSGRNRTEKDTRRNNAPADAANASESPREKSGRNKTEKDTRRNNASADAANANENPKEKLGRSKTEKDTKKNRDKEKESVADAQTKGDKGSSKNSSTNASNDHITQAESAKPKESNAMLGATKEKAKESVSPSLAKKVAAANSMSVQNGSLGQADFPALGNAVKAKPPANSSWGKPRNLEDDFPPISAASAAPTPTTTKSSKKKGKKKAGESKTAPSSGSQVMSNTSGNSEEPVIDYTRIVPVMTSGQGSKTTQSEPSEVAVSMTTALPDTSSAEDFPSLSSIASSLTSGTVKKPSVPPGFAIAASKAPPGFQPDVKKPPRVEKQKPKSRAPPGFGTTTPVVTSAAPLTLSDIASTSLSAPTLTPSAATEVTKPTVKASAPKSETYLPPDNFQQRNQDLIVSIQKLLDNSYEKFEEFKTLSGNYRRGKLQGHEYYTQCKELLGQNNFSKIFSELVALLPDRERQQELLRIHNDFKVKEKEEKHTQKYPDVLKISNGSKKSKPNSGNPWNVESSQCLTCPNCRQVVLTKDYNKHIASHELDMDFPALSVSMKMATPTPTTGNAWVKGK